MGKTFQKSVIKDIKRSLGRFLSIIAIIALGVGFLVGIMAATPTLKRSYSDNYRNSLVADIDYKGYMGVSKDEVVSLLDKEGDISYGYGKVDDISVESTTGLSFFGRVYNVNDEYIKGITELVEGRYPTSPQEALVIMPTKKLLEIEEGTILSTTHVETLMDSYLENQIIFEDVKVVGVVKSPLFISRDNEPSYTSSSPLETVIFVPYDESQTIITDVFIKYHALDDLNRFSKQYFKELARESKNLTSKLDEITASKRVELLEFLDGPLASYILSEQEIAYYKTMIPATFNQLTLKENASYNYLEINAEKVDTIVSIFPPFFFFVAALVALTSVTRLVEEDRTLIGTYKALGYTKAQIALKYIAYGGISSVVGAILGVSVGIFLLPLIIFQAFGTNFILCNFALSYHLLGTLLSFFGSIIMTILVSFFSSYQSLRETPAALMKPKAPKAGSKILMERIPFIWKRLKFKNKSTLRNLFRYKKHLIMTVFGVFGSATLLFAGFAIQDSFKALTDVTYKEIRHYQMSIEGQVDSNEFKTYFESKEGVSYVAYLSNMVEFKKGSDTYSTELVVLDDLAMETFNDFYTIRSGKTKDTIDLKSQPVVISDQLADRFNYDEGDTISFTYNGLSMETKLSKVNENYLDNYLFMNKSTYETLFNSTYATNKALIKCSEAMIDTLTSELENAKFITSITSESENKESYESLMSSIQLIDYVLVIAALTLSVVIIYNITTVNISERKRELATLKVLGYKNYETAGYVMRVIFILSVFGILLGLGGGYLLTTFVVVSTESIGIRYGRVFSPWTYLLTLFVMLVFILAIDALMIPKIKKINPAESLKSIE